jgi:hypothetical protein
MDVVDKITQVPMDIATAKPYTDIVIEKITVSKYNNSKFSEYKIADIELAKSEAQSNYNALIFKDKEQEEIQRESDTEAKEKKLKEDAGRVAKA